MTARCLRAGSLLACLLASGVAGAERLDGRLGAACTSDEGCTSAGLRCLLPTLEPATMAAPVRGSCTLPCDENADCSPYSVAGRCACIVASDSGTCRGYCAEACTIGMSAPAGLDPEKCHGRSDVGCTSSPLTTFTSLSPPADAGMAAAATSPQSSDDSPFVCLPRCRGIAADSSLCQGTPFGGSCVPPDYTLGEKDPCTGFCFPGGLAYYRTLFVEGLLVPFSFTEAACIERCVIGAPDSCGVSHRGNPGVCVLGGVPLVFGVSPGDLGFCAEGCSCSSQCGEGELCEPWNLQGISEALGICVPGPRPAGAADCLPPRGSSGSALACPYGPVRACRADTCLGTASCLPSGEYGACECQASAPLEDAGAGNVPPDRAAADAGVGASNEPTAKPARESGCAFATAVPYDTSIWFWSLLLTAALRRRVSSAYSRSITAFSAGR